MREITISQDQEGRRFDKFLLKYLNEAPSSFIYKMLRKKNITLNDKKSDGTNILVNGDVIKIYMSDETIEKFRSNKATNNTSEASKDISAHLLNKMPQVIFEDENIIIANKPKGMLSQKASDEDISFNEIALYYLQKKGELKENSDFTPSICNRLDRNTEGLIIFAKTYAAAREIGESLRDHSLNKYYRCIVKGDSKLDTTLSGSLTKNNKTNTVSVKNNIANTYGNIYTKVTTVWNSGDLAELEILLLTGKTHQIRAHLASIGRPLIGDFKYGDLKINNFYKSKFGISSQMLIAYKIVMPEFDGKMKYLSNREFTIPVPKEFVKVRKYVDMEI